MAISDPQHTLFLQHVGNDTNGKMLSGNCHFLAMKHCKVEVGEGEEEEEARLVEEGFEIEGKKDKEQGEEN